MTKGMREINYLRKIAGCVVKYDNGVDFFFINWRLFV